MSTTMELVSADWHAAKLSSVPGHACAMQGKLKLLHVSLLCLCWKAQSRHQQQRLV